jgi:hypothetical protein
VRGVMEVLARQQPNRNLGQSLRSNAVPTTPVHYIFYYIYSSIDNTQKYIYFLVLGTYSLRALVYLCLDLSIDLSVAQLLDHVDRSENAANTADAR